MQYGQIPGVGKPVSRLLQGNAGVGTDDLDRTFRLLDAAYALGCNAFDTAHIYGGGQSERALGVWVRSRSVRDKIVMLDKGAHHDDTRRRVTPADIAKDLSESLDRLGFDYVDLYVLHRDDPGVPVGEVVDALNEHIRAGRVRAIGGSNWSAARLAAANDYARSRGLVGMVVSSPQFSLAAPTRELFKDGLSISGPAGQAERAWYRQTQLAVVAYSALAGGFFSGRFTRESARNPEDWQRYALDSFGTEDNFRRMDRCQELAWRKNLSAQQIALAYVTSQGMNTFVISGASRPEHFAAAAAAMDVALTPAEVEYLDLKSDRRE